MSETSLAVPIQDQVRDFTCGLLSCTGGIVDWDSESGDGVALVSAEVAQCLGQPEESFALTTDVARSGLCLSLAGEFVELASKTLQHFVPARGSFQLRDLTVSKSDFQKAVDAVFGWQNARGYVMQGVVAQVAYHAWWFHVILHADDAWETIVPVTVNAESRLPIDMGNIFETMELSAAAGQFDQPKETLLAGARRAQLQVMCDAVSFLARADERLLRDRKRLRDYYHAMLKDASTPNRRTKTEPTDEEVESRERAVKLELKRKLGELDDRYAFDATIKPIALAVCHIPAVAIEVEIQRKSAKRAFRVFWNGVLKRVEPLACSQCGEGRFNFWFTNDNVDPVCNTCHSKAKAPSQESAN